MKRLIALILILISSSKISVGQLDTANFQSIPITLKGWYGTKYAFNHPRLAWGKTGSAKVKKADKGSYSTGNLAEDLSADILVKLLGFETSTRREMNWLVKSQIICSNELLNWDIEVYGVGELLKEKVREENEEGDKVVSTYKYADIFWGEGADGFIIENENPIGKFYIFLSPQKDSTFYMANEDVFSQPKFDRESKYQGKYFRDIRLENAMQVTNYAAVGLFRNQEYVIISNNEARTICFFENNELISIYHPGIHGNAISKADKVMPKLLVSEDISNGKLVDLYRLVLFSNHLDKTLRKERIPK